MLWILLTGLAGTRVRNVLGVAVTACLILALPAGAAADTIPSRANATSATSPAWVQTAKKQLGKLKVRSSGSMSDYSRSNFGAGWKDVDENGCDTRNDILSRDLKRVVLKIGSSCIVATGTLKDPYTGKTINFVRGVRTSIAVQIDHIVALAAAWRTGARGWTAKRRLAYANDRLVLLAVDGPTNGSKGDRDAADWLPPRAAYRCRYVAKQIAIKRKYNLWVRPAERNRMAQLLATC